MDKELSPEITSRTRTRRWLLIAVVSIAVVGGVIYIRSLLQTSVDASRIRIATADIGPVENTLNATGEVIPALSPRLVQ